MNQDSDHKRSSRAPQLVFVSSVNMRGLWGGVSEATRVVHVKYRMADITKW